MLRKLTLAIGFGAGYVLGAKAGRPRYEQIMTKARELAGKPAVQDLRDSAAEHVGQVADLAAERAKAAAHDAVAGVTAKVTGNTDDSIDLTSTAAKNSRS